DGIDGSISTLPLAFKPFAHTPEHRGQCVEQLLSAADALARLRDETGRVVRLAIEPEPFCLLETTPETIRFFEELRRRASDSRQLEAAREHLGVCYDVCHQAVEFEDIPRSIRDLTAAGIRMNKVHITCAVQLDAPRDNLAARQALAHYAEERYLHQTFARSSAGTIYRQ